MGIDDARSFTLTGKELRMTVFLLPLSRSAYLWCVNKHRHFKVAMVPSGNTKLRMIAGSISLIGI